MKLKKALCGVAILLLTANQSFCFASASTSITRDDIAVLRAILSSGCGTTNGRYRVVSDIPVSAPDYAPAPAWPPTSLWTRLAARVPSGIRWPHLRICAAKRIVDGTKVNSIFSRQTRIPPSWDPFYAEFPGAEGLLGISLPAFTADRNHAVVYLESTCNPLCGAGFYVGLTRRKGGWKTSHRENAWIS